MNRKYDEGSLSVLVLDEGNLQFVSENGVENNDDSGIIKENKEKTFDINSLPEQIHHFATNKNSKFTPLFNEIVNKYGLNLDGNWNKGVMGHLGRHPNEYHEFIFKHMTYIDVLASGNTKKFLEHFENVKKEVLSRQEMLRKDYWIGE